MQNIKPKLGNASTLFNNDEPKGLEAFAPKNKTSRNMIGWISGVAALACLITSVFLFQQSTSTLAKEISLPNSQAIANDGSIEIIHAKNDSGELVGTLVRMDAEVDDESAIPATTTNLTEAERQHLLEIINSQ